MKLWNRDFQSQVPHTLWKPTLLTWIGILLLFILIFSSSASATEISTIEVFRFGNYDNIVIRTTGWIKPHASYDEAALRLEIVFPAAIVNGKITVEKIDSPRIKNIVAENYKEGSKVTFSLSKEIKFELATIFGQNRVLLEITDAPQKPEEVAEEEKEPEKRKEPAPVPSVTVKKPNEEEKPKKIEKPKKVTKPKRKEPNPLKGKVIVIDPGHGGIDAGTIGRYGTLEKHVTLPLALKLSRLLQDNGAKVLLTRKSDITTDYRKIVRFANRNNADIFIAIHYNSSQSSRVGGIETFYYTKKSKLLAQIVHKNIVYGIKRRNRGVRREMFYAIHHTRMPAILIEPGYISNPTEERLAKSVSFQWEVARDITRGLKEYFKRVK